MVQAELTIFSTPTCSVCRELEAVLREKGVKFRVLDVSADREALVLLLRYAGQPIVPTVVAYGEVMVGFDALRLEQLLDGLNARAEAFARRDGEEEEQLRESEAFVEAAEREAIAFGDKIERPPED
jgi:glutaredoxin